MSCIAVLVDFILVFSFWVEAAKTLWSSIYNGCVTLVLIGLESRYPSVALSFRKTGFRQIVNRLGGSRLLKWITFDTSGIP